MIAWWLVLACGPTDPALDRQRRALERWDEAKAALEAHEPEKAEAALTEALAEDPGDPVLQVWWARAAADRGAVDVAIARLDALLAQRPSYGPALYDRAAYLARNGEADAAAQALRLALTAGGGPDAAAARADPDFAPWRAHPAFVELLPPPTLRVAVEGPEGSVFKGSEFAVHVRAIGVPDGEPPLDVVSGDASGPIALVSVVEQRRPSTAGAIRDVTWTWRVEGAGPVVFGPLKLAAGEAAGAIGELRVDAYAPPGRELAGPLAVPNTLVTASALRAVVGIGAVRRGEDVAVGVVPGDRVEVTPRAEGVRYEVRGDDGVEWVGWRFPATVTHVRVTRQGTTVADAGL